MQLYDIKMCVRACVRVCVRACVCGRVIQFYDINVCVCHASGLIGGQRTFFFNISSVMPSEEVLKAELHVYRKKKKRRFAIAIKLNRVSGNRLQELDNPREISRDSFGWHSRDVSSDVNACLAERHRDKLILTATFSAKRRNGRLIPMRMAKFMRHMSPPFLVVFSRDTHNNSLDEIDPRLGEDDPMSSYIDPNSGRADSFGGRRTKRNANVDGVSETRSTHRYTRHRRSIFDNEIPGAPKSRIVNLASEHSVSRSHPSILQGRTQFRKRVSNSRLLPFPPDFERRRRRRKHHRKQRRRNRLDYGIMGSDRGDQDDVEALDEVDDSADNSHLCRRRKLVVDFADIGWSQWVISPKSFEAHYCAGACPFPMARVSNRRVFIANNIMFCRSVRRH